MTRRFDSLRHPTRASAERRSETQCWGSKLYPLRNWPTNLPSWTRCLVLLRWPTRAMCAVAPPGRRRGVNRLNRGFAKEGAPSLLAAVTGPTDQTSRHAPTPAVLGRGEAALGKRFRVAPSQQDSTREGSPSSRPS